MSRTGTMETGQPSLIDNGFMIRVFYVFAALALLSVGISVTGKWVGSSIATVGHSTDTSIREIVIGNNVLSVPANEIRFDRQRVNGDAQRLDVYLRWPDLEGYSNAARDDFNHRDGRRTILFLTVEPSIMSRDMSGRLEPIYRRLIELPAMQGPAGLRLYKFRPDSGYTNEVLAVGERPGEEPFVARCLSADAAASSLAACERDVHFGDALSLAYRFPDLHLAAWRELDAAVMEKARRYLQIAG